MLAFLTTMFKINANNTPHAFRKICAPWGVAFFVVHDIFPVYVHPSIGKSIFIRVPEILRDLPLWREVQ